MVEPTATIVPVPTFTPTPFVENTPTHSPTPLMPTDTPVATPESATAAPTVAVVPTETPVTESLLTVNAAAINVRGGPGTEYAQIGVSTAGSQYPITARNAAGDWWQVCCFDGQAGWLFGGLVTVQNAENVALAADIPVPPVLPTATPAPAVVDLPTATPEAVVVAPVAAEPVAAQPVAPPSTAHSGSAGNFDPNAQYQIVGFRVLGFGENNGGIFNAGGQHHIFVTVLDQNGNGVDGAVVKDAVGDKLNVVTGSKGPGRAEISMAWDPYKLYVAADSAGPVTSQISNQMNTANPHIPDIVGRLGPVDNEYAICPTLDDRCTPPFYHAHWSYEITFQKVR